MYNLYRQHFYLEKLFEAIKFNRNPSFHKYCHSRYDIILAVRGTFSLSGGWFGKNVILLSVEMSSSVHFDNKRKNILILGESQTQGIGDTTLITGTQCSINFTEERYILCLRLNYNGNNNHLFVNGEKKVIQNKKNEFVPYPLCLGKITKSF